MTNQAGDTIVESLRHGEEICRRLVAVREDEGAQALAVRHLPIKARADVGRDSRLPRLQDQRAHAARRRLLRLQALMDVALHQVQPQWLDFSSLAPDLQAVLRVMRQIVLQALAEGLFLGGRLRAHVSSSSASSWLSVRAPPCSTVCSRGCR